MSRPKLTPLLQRAYDQALEIISACRCEQRTSLALSALNLTCVPPEIGQLTHLTKLNLWGNKLDSLPPEIGCLVNLQSLTVENNHLKSLPPEIGLLAELTEINLCGNQLSSLPPEIGLLEKLKELHLGGNQLGALPSEIGLLDNLWSLDLRDNQLSALPPEIAKLEKLRNLGLSKNRLKRLLQEIGQLGGLWWLDLSGNHLTVLPSEICCLEQLKRLNLEGNDLCEIPESLKRLTHLEELTVHGNHALKLPTEVLGCARFQSNPHLPKAKPQAILDFYFAQKKEQPQGDIIQRPSAEQISTFSTDPTSLSSTQAEEGLSLHTQGAEGEHVQSLTARLGNEPAPSYWDVFISAKSEDYALARKVFHFFKAQRLNPFFSDESLPKLGNSDYRKEIDCALERARHIVVVTTSRKNIESPWVEAEWGFFINEKRAGRKPGNIVTIIAGDLLPSDLPPSLRGYQALNHDDAGLQKLLAYVCQET